MHGSRLFLDLCTKASDNHYVLSNVLKDELHAFLKELDNAGWKIENVHRQDGTHEMYSFKRPLE